MATTTNYLRHAIPVFITAEKKMKDAKKKFKDEWYWDGHLISTKNDCFYPSIDSMQHI